MRKRDWVHGRRQPPRWRQGAFGQHLDEEPVHLGGDHPGAGAGRPAGRRRHLGDAGRAALFRFPRQGRRRHRQERRHRQGDDHRPARRQQRVPHQHRPRSDPDPAPCPEGRPLRRRARADHLAVDAPALPVAALPADPRHRLLRDAPDAEECRLGRDGLRPLQGQTADREARPGDVRRRRRHRRGARGTAGDRRVPEGSDQVRPPRRQDPQGRPAGRLARHRQDPARPRHRRRGQRAVLHHFGLGLRRDVRRRRREPRPRHVRAGQEERALHHLHRRNRRGRPPSRRRPRRRQRRARADAEPAAGRDGRLRGQ